VSTERPPHRSGSVPIAFRLPPEQVECLDQAAAATGHDRSGYLRETVIGATSVTAATVAKVRREARREERAAADIEIRLLRAQLDQAVQLRAAAQRRIHELEGDLRISSTRILSAVRRVLMRDRGARTELNRLWACLEPADRLSMLPALVSAIDEGLDGVLEERSTLGYQRERDRQVVANVAHRRPARSSRSGRGPRSSRRATDVADRYGHGGACHQRARQTHGPLGR
jgi:uncharacterized protein (DUF1778 family)